MKTLCLRTRQNISTCFDENKTNVRNISTIKGFYLFLQVNVLIQ